MRLGVLAGIGRDWHESLEKVRIADSLGYELVATGEAWGPSTVPWMTLLAAHTRTIQIGTSILNIYSRTPGAIAQEFAMLEVLSGGRMVCGLGSSGHRVIEHFHGVPFDTPLRRIREYVEIINLLIKGERLNYDGRIFSMSRGFRLDYERPRDHVPIYIAAITPKSIRQTGEIADGIFPIHWPKNHFASLRRDLGDASAAAGRNPDSVTIAPFTNVYVLGGDAGDAGEAEDERDRPPSHAKGLGVGHEEGGEAEKDEPRHKAGQAEARPDDPPAVEDPAAEQPVGEYVDE